MDAKAEVEDAERALLLSKDELEAALNSPRFEKQPCQGNGTYRLEGWH